MITKTMYVISVDDERYISETVKETFGCGGEYTGSELRPSLTYSILEAKHFYSEGEALAFLETDKFKNAWRWNPVFSILKHYFIKEVKIEFFEKIIKTISVLDIAIDVNSFSQFSIIYIQMLKSTYQSLANVKIKSN